MSCHVLTNKNFIKTDSIEDSLWIGLSIEKQKWNELLVAIKTLVDFAQIESKKKQQENQSVKKSVLKSIDTLYKNLFKNLKSRKIDKHELNILKENTIDWDKKLKELTNEEFDTIVDSIYVCDDA